MAGDIEICPKCASEMRNVDQRMVVESQVIRIVLSFECPQCGTTVQSMATIDRDKTPWVKKTVYRGESLEFVYSEQRGTQ